MLEHTEEESDLGVLLDEELIFESHICSKVSKANALLGIIRRNFAFLDKSMVLQLYKVFVRPHLEYAQSVWSPKRPGLITMIENVQKRALNLIPEFRGLDYSEQLRRSNIPSLSFRRLRGDMIEAFKHFTTYDKSVLSPSFKPNVRHPHKLYQSHSTSTLVDRLFYHRIQELWNGLNPTVQKIALLSDIDPEKRVNKFKNELDKHWKDLPLRFDYKAGRPSRTNMNELPNSSQQRQRTG